MRIAIGMRDVEQGKVELFRRDTEEKILINKEELSTKVVSLLEEIQKTLFEKHEAFTREHTYEVDTYEEFKEKIEKGFVLAHRDGTKETADKIQEETRATIRCYDFKREKVPGTCIYSGKPSIGKVIFAKSY